MLVRTPRAAKLCSSGTERRLRDVGTAPARPQGWHQAGQSSPRRSCSSTFPGAALSAVFYSGSSVRPADSRPPALAAATRRWDGDSSVRAVPRCSPAEAKSRASAG